MTRFRSYGFTLIELLIVIAIINIICISSLAVITGPMFERVRSEDQEAFETGAGTLFASLVQDAHNATSMDAATSGSVIFSLASEPPVTVTYTINSSGTLTRQRADQTVVNLVPRVVEFHVENQTTGSLATFYIQGRLRGYRGDTIIHRRMDINVGQQAWTGGA